MKRFYIDLLLALGVLAFAFLISDITEKMVHYDLLSLINNNSNEGLESPRLGSNRSAPSCWHN